LLQLGEMAVGVADRVGAEVLGHFAEEELPLGVSPGPRDTRRRVDDHFA